MRTGTGNALQDLVADIVMGLEVSRLARNNADWQRLLEICALADTLTRPLDNLNAANKTAHLIEQLSLTFEELAISRAA